MNLTNQAIDRPRTVTVLTILVLLMALYAAVFTPVQRSPAITKAVVIVAIPYPDSDPAKGESNIARKVEDELKELKSVDFIASSSMRGSSVMQVIFLDGKDPDDARIEVKDLINRITNELPAGREVQPIVTDIDFENMPLMLVNITAPAGFDERSLKQIAEDVQDQLETVDGVANTQLFGGKEREIHVNVNPDLMTQYGLTLQQVTEGAGRFSRRGSRRRVHHRRVRPRHPQRDRAAGRGRYPRGDRQRPRGPGDPDLGHRRGDRRVTARCSIRPSSTVGPALIIVNKEADINTLGAARGVREVVDSLRDEYPDFEFSITRDASSEIWVMFRVLGSSAIFGAMLVLVILAWTMGLRISLLVLIAIPFSMSVGLMFLFFAGIAVSNMVVFASSWCWAWWSTGRSSSPRTSTATSSAARSRSTPPRTASTRSACR